MKTSILSTFCLFVLLITVCSSSLSQDWPQWRGQNRDGVAVGAKLPAKWPEELPLKWKTSVGPGYSTPVLAAGRVFFLERKGDDEVIRALDAETGNEVWKRAYSAPYTIHPHAARHGNSPKATTTVADGRVYSFGISGILCALDASNGTIIWKRDLGKEFESNPQFGASASPLVDRGLVILPVGHEEGGGGLMAFRAGNGEIAWGAVRDGPSYASPIAADLAGVWQVISFTAKHLVGVSLEDGEELWFYPFEVRFDETIVTPMVWKDLVVFAGRSNGGTRALRLRREEGHIIADEVWKQPKAPVYMSSPVIKDDHLFGLEHNTGKFFCLSLKDGSIAWKEDNFGDYASLVLAGDRILILDSGGTLTAITASSESYKKLFSIRVSDAKIYAHLVVAGNRLYIRDFRQVLCFEL